MRIIHSRSLSTLSRLLTVTVGLLTAATIACATPWFAQDPRTLPQGAWRVEEHVLYSDITDALAAGENAPLAGGVASASATTLHTRLRYGLRDDLTVFVDAPYVFKRTHGPGGLVRDNSALGDLVFLAKYKYAEDKQAGKRRAVALIYKADTGDTEGLPGLLATGSGQSNLGLIHLWEWRARKATWYASAGYTWTDTRSDNGRNPGDLWTVNLALEQPLGQGAWRAIGELNGQYEGNASGGGATPATSGATVVSFSPGLQYVNQRPSGKSTTWEAGVQLPLITEGNLPALANYTFYAGGYLVF